MAASQDKGPVSFLLLIGVDIFAHKLADSDSNLDSNSRSQSAWERGHIRDGLCEESLQALAQVTRLSLLPVKAYDDREHIEDGEDIK